MPTGTRNVNGSFAGRNGLSLMWLSTPSLSYSYYSWVGAFSGGSNGALGLGDVRAIGFSVRCIKN